MKKSKMPKTHDSEKIIRWVSRENEFERNGGGQWVAKNRPHKNKKKYDRKQNKKELSKQIDNSFSLFIIIISEIITTHMFWRTSILPTISSSSI